MSNHVYCARAGEDRTSVYDEITNKIIAELEAGRVPWVQPWGTAAAKAPLAMPRNASTDRQYSGVNVLLLWGSTIEHGFAGQSWLTFRQALSLGGHVRKGERGTVLSFAVIADFFPEEMAARANGALNLLHFGWAFAVQYGIGLVVGQWPALDGRYPTIAYQYAFALSLVFQAATMVWFVIPRLCALREYLYRLLARPAAKQYEQTSLVRMADRESILEVHGPMEW